MNNKTKYTKQEIAEMIGMSYKSVAALCSPSKQTLLTDENDSRLIDITIEKNARYIREKIRDKQIGLQRTFGKARRKKQIEVVEELEDIEQPKKTTIPTIRKVKKKNEEVKLSKEVEEQLKIEESNLRAIDKAKVRKTEAEAELKELELKKKRGDLISASEIAPFVANLSKTKDDTTLVETMSLVKDLISEYSLPGEFIGKFEREFISILNGANESAINKFKKDIQ